MLKQECDDLFEAITQGNQDKVRQFVAKGMDVSIKNKEGFSALHVAFALGQEDIIELLLDAGADSNSLLAYKLEEKSCKMNSDPDITLLVVELELLWCSILGYEPGDVDGDTDFFSSGGDSLSATRLINKIKQQYSVDLTLQDINKFSTLKALALRIQESIPRGEITPELIEI